MYTHTLKSLNYTIGKRKPIQSRELSEGEKFPILPGANLECSELKFAGHNHWAAKVVANGGWWFFYKPHFDLNSYDLIAWEHFKACLPYARNQDLRTYFEPINFAMAEFEINNLKRIACFLAQIAHECGSLRWKEELASGAAYEGRKDLGNYKAGDGKRYKGRGLIQLTGRNNYAWAKKELGVDLINNPTLAASDPLLSARIAGLYWQSRGLNKLADRFTVQSFKLITRRINGGYNGYGDRLAHLRRMRKVLYV